MYQKDTINVCVSTDENYAKHAGVLIASILNNANKEDNLSIYILDGGIKQETKEKILCLKSIKECEINFIDIDEKPFEEYTKVKSHNYLSLATYYRLKLATLLPNQDKIIYLDCDMVVNSSLKKLFDTNFEENIIAGVCDLNKKMLKENPNYINAGLVVFDLDKIRKNNIEDEFLSYTQKHVNEIKMGDQEIINEVLKGKIKIVDDIWNVQSSNFINRSSYIKSPNIVHFVSKKKPWHWASFSVHKELYFKYLQLTPWRLDEKEYKYWTKQNQIASIFSYLKYRPLFFLRPRFYYAFYQEYLKDFLMNVFSITDYNETHKLIRLFGLRIRTPKIKYAIERKRNPYYKYIKNNVDITTIPPATGQLRELQLANLELLKELDYVCTKNNFDYWLDFGSVLGAIRHKGFIPWDDDVDVGMPRQFYNKIVEVFNRDTRNPDIFASIRRYNDESPNMIIKLSYKRCSHLFVDIFPYDVYGEKLSQEKRTELTDYIKTQRRKMKDALRANPMHDKDFKPIIENFKKEILKNGENLPLDSSSDLLWGIDFFHTWKQYFYDFDTIYPLKKIKYENIEFLCANKTEKLLEQVYGNYMGYPKKIGFGHNGYVPLTKEEKEAIKELIEGRKQ